MAIRTSAIHGSEQSGTEEAEIRTAEATARLTRTATAIGSAAVRAGVGKVKKTLRERQERLATEPELQGNLYKGFREAFISHGVPKDLAAEAAADLVQNKDAANSTAIAEANRIVSQGANHQHTAGEQSQVSDSEENDVGEEKPLSITAKEHDEHIENAETNSLPLNKGAVISSVEQSSTSTKKVEFEEPPSKMNWPTLQKTAKAIADETGEKPASGKKVDVEPFVTNYWKAQQEEKALAAKPVVRTPVQSPTPTLAKDYSAGLVAAGADSEIAAKAGKALVEGEDAHSSVEIAKANSQVSEAPARSKLQQMYYDVLEKQKAIDPELTELASKDLAEGKGAHSSDHVRAAHDKILNRELARSGLDSHRQNWSKYSRHITEPDPSKRDRLIGSAAMRDGISAKDTKTMIRWSSPIAAQINQQQGSTAMANYADSIVSQVKARSVTKQMATGKAIAPVKKGKGAEI